MEEEEEEVTYLTKQEAFTKMVLGLREQGWQKATDSNGGCMYRTPRGLRCAVGMLIPPNKYNYGSMEGVAPSVVLGSCGLAAVPEEKPRFAKFLNDAQVAHDEAHDRLDMFHRFQALAKAYGLEFPVEAESGANSDS